MVYDDLDISEAVRVALFDEFGSRLAIACENIDFEQPEDGGMWLKFDYFPADKRYRSLDRKCIALIGMVQVGIMFPPGSGIDKARELAKEIANFFHDGKILSVGYILEGASSKPVQKSQSGWLLPIRFTTRYDEKEV